MVVVVGRTLVDGINRLACLDSCGKGETQIVGGSGADLFVDLRQEPGYSCVSGTIEIAAEAEAVTRTHGRGIDGTPLRRPSRGYHHTADSTLASIP